MLQHGASLSALGQVSLRLLEPGGETRLLHLPAAAAETRLEGRELRLKEINMCICNGRRMIRPVGWLVENTFCINSTVTLTYIFVQKNIKIIIREDLGQYYGYKLFKKLKFRV